MSNHDNGGLVSTRCGATPSSADLAITADAVRAGDLLGIRVLDHVIIGRTGRGYSSVADWEHEPGWAGGATAA